MPTDIEIARSVTPLPITEVAKNAGVDVKHLIPYGFDKAKVDYSLLNEPTDHQAKLVLVTAINPTPAGEGKTTTTNSRASPPRPSVWPMACAVAASRAPWPCASLRSVPCLA